MSDLLKTYLHMRVINMNMILSDDLIGKRAIIKASVEEVFRTHGNTTFDTSAAVTIKGVFINKSCMYVLIMDQKNNLITTSIDYLKLVKEE